MNKRKLLTLAMTLCMVAILAIGGTLAYFTDTDNAKNAMTIGNLEITVTEENDNGAPFNEDAYTVIPGKANYIDKHIVTTLKPGSVEAYVRNIVLFEVTDATNGWNWSENVGFTKHLPTETISVEWVEGVVTIDGVPYVAGIFYPKSVTLKAGESYTSINRVWLADRVENAELEALGTKYNILTMSQAVQYEGNTNTTAKAALDAAFEAVTLDNLPTLFDWVSGTVD